MLYDCQKAMIAFQEDLVQHILIAGESLLQEFPWIASVLFGRKEPGKNLHIGSRHIPTGMQ